MYSVNSADSFLKIQKITERFNIFRSIQQDIIILYYIKYYGEKYSTFYTI